jgi:hypothetical protein
MSSRPSSSFLAVALLCVPVVLAGSCLGARSDPAEASGEDDGAAASKVHACGASGQPCCTRSPACTAGLFCNSSRTCIQGTCSGRDPTYAQLFRLGITNAYGCAVTTITELASSLVEAELCAGDVAGAGNVVASGTPQTYCFTLTGFGTSNVQVTAFSADDAARCAQSQCLNCTVAPCE